MVAIAEQLSREQLARTCREYHVKRLWLFGSRARGENRPESDFDLLVEFADGHTPGFFRFGELADRLSEVLQADQEIDLVTERSLHRLIRPHVMKERVLLYEG